MRIKSILFSLFFCLFISQQAYAATIRINAPKIELELAAGETYTGEIVAENPTTDPCKTKIYLEDWTYKAGGTGEKLFTPAGSTTTSASPWIKFSPAEETIAPFAKTVVRYTITVPPDVQGAYFSVLFFETALGTATDEEGVNVLVSGRIGSLFVIHIKGAHIADGKIESLVANAPSGNKPFEFVTTFKNTGNVDIALGGKFLIMDSTGKPAARGDMNKIYTFPGATESGTTQWVGRLPKGDYDLIVTYDLGKGKTLVEEKSVKIA